jgi:hypothetical protein
VDGGDVFLIPADSEAGLPILWPPDGGYMLLGGRGPTVEVIRPRLVWNGQEEEWEYDWDPVLCPRKKAPGNSQGVSLVAIGGPAPGGTYNWGFDENQHNDYAFYQSTQTGLTYYTWVSYTNGGKTSQEADTGFIRVFDADLTFQGGSSDPQDTVEDDPGFFMALGGPRKSLSLALDPADPDDVMPRSFDEDLHPRGLLPPYQVGLSGGYPCVEFYEAQEGGTPLTYEDLLWGWTEVEWEVFEETPAPEQIYVQAKAAGTCIIGLGLMFRCPQECGDWLADNGSASDYVKVSVLGVDLDMQDVPDPQEENPGGFVALGGLRAITLQVLPATLPPADEATLTWTNDAKIDVYENQDRTNPINSGQTYALSALPQTLYVEGDEASGQPRDIEMKLSYSKGGATAEDVVKLTVADVVTVDVEAYNGQGGSMVPEPDEETKGVFTVANLNDTDADSQQDSPNDYDVPGEKDLLKIVLKKPDPDCGGSVTLSLTGDGTKTKVWKSSTKAAGVENARQFTTASLPQELWVEGLQKSTQLRDVEIKLQYQSGTATFEDKAKATFIWAEKTNFRNTGTSLSPDADGEDISESFRDTYASHLGLYIAPFPVAVHNAMEMEFTVFPAGIGSEAAVRFDVTRQVKSRAWLIDVGVPFGPSVVDFPTGGDADEKPNDDTYVDDEDNEPTNNHIYSIDAPGYWTYVADSNFRMVLRTFREFVRVKFNGTFANDETIEGSRCSPREPWHSITYIKRGPGPDWIWERDYADVSASAPLPMCTGNGTMSVPATGAAAVTEGWTVTYAAADGKWTVVGTESGTQTNKATTGAAYTSDDGEVSFTITEGGTPFADGDQFKFSTFRTQRQEGKKNDVDLGEITVTGDP